MINGHVWYRERWKAAHILREVRSGTLGGGYMCHLKGRNPQEFFFPYKHVRVLDTAGGPEPSAAMDTKKDTDSTTQQGQEAVSRGGARPEEKVQAASIRALLAARYLVLQTTVRYRPCPKCGHNDYRHSGQTPGIPDILVRRPEWETALWRGIEIKREGYGLGDVKPAQRTLAAGRHIIVIDDPADAVPAAAGGREPEPLPKWLQRLRTGAQEGNDV